MTPIKSLELIDGLLTEALKLDEKDKIPSDAVSHVQRVCTEQLEMHRLGLFGEAGE